MQCMVRMARMISLFGLLVLVCSCAVGTQGPQSGPDGPGAALHDLMGAEHRPMQVQDRGAAGLFFVLYDCPICNEYAPEINRIVADYRDRGLTAYVVAVDPDVSIEELKNHAKE